MVRCESQVRNRPLCFAKIDAFTYGVCLFYHAVVLRVVLLSAVVLSIVNLKHGSDECVSDCLRALLMKCLVEGGAERIEPTMLLPKLL